MPHQPAPSEEHGFTALLSPTLFIHSLNKHEQNPEAGEARMYSLTDRRRDADYLVSWSLPLGSDYRGSDYRVQVCAWVAVITFERHSSFWQLSEAPSDHSPGS